MGMQISKVFWSTDRKFFYLCLRLDHGPIIDSISWRLVQGNGISSNASAGSQFQRDCLREENGFLPFLFIWTSPSLVQARRSWTWVKGFIFTGTPSPAEDSNPSTLVGRRGNGSGPRTPVSRAGQMGGPARACKSTTHLISGWHGTLCLTGRANSAQGFVNRVGPSC